MGLENNGRKPTPCRHPLPVVRQLFEHIDATSRRARVWRKAGYSNTAANSIGRGKGNPSLRSFVDLCEAAGLEIKLVTKEPPP